MNLSNLKYAVEVEKTGSITRAAQNFYMNQPHLSKIIREIERDLGFPIFDRTGRGMVPTEQGEKFLKYAKVILAQEEQIEFLRQDARSSARSLRLSAPQSSYIPQALSAFVNSSCFPESLNISFTEVDSRQIIRRVSGRESDLGILRCQQLHLPYYEKMLREENLESRILWSFSLLLVLSPLHPLAAEASLTYLDLTSYTMIALEGSPLPDLSLESQASVHKTAQSKQCLWVSDRGSQLELLCRIPKAYCWDCPIPPETLRQLNLVQKNCSCPGNSFCDLLIWRSSHHFTREEESFMEWLNKGIES